MARAMTRGGLFVSAGAVAVVLAACNASVKSSTSPESTTSQSPATTASGGLDAAWAPAPLVEAASPEAALAETPSPEPGLCADVVDMNLGDPSEPLAIRVTFEQPGAEDALVAVMTLQQWTDPEGADVNLAVMAQRNELTDDFPAVEGARARLNEESPFPGSEGTPVAWARGSYTVLISVTPGHESQLQDWAGAVDAFLVDGTPATPAPACS